MEAGRKPRVTDVDPSEAWRILSEQSDARLVDVRTRAEWNFVGVPELGELGAEPFFLEWSSFPDMSVNSAFAETLEKAFGRAVTGPILFLCRSGVRSQKLIELCKTSNRTVLTYGLQGQDLQILSITPQNQGQSIELKIKNKTYRINLNLVGDFQVSNALCALGLVLADAGVDQDKAVAALETLQGAPGRLQYIAHPTDAAIYVDYAHTPDALEHVLKALKPHTQNNLICLFGCGGDRDHGKRKIMGEVSATLADQIIVTDDNPRSEDAASIRAEILKGAPTATEIADRRTAIQEAVATLTKGDVLVVAGKGHEQGQIFADHTQPFDDVTEVKQAIKNL
ncbi:MAG: cyanophycin synthetase, partial [Pseudomonadota bacterium]